MRNHSDKIRDISRSVLPSTRRRPARLNRRHIHHTERRAVAAALRNGDEAPRRDDRRDMSELVGERRAADKVGPLVRWALHHVRTNPEVCQSSWHDQVEHFRQLLPDTTIGRHALSHIAWPLEFRHPDPPVRWYSSDRPSGPPASLAPTVRALYEAGYHGALNTRLKIALLPTLAGVADIEAFSAHATRDVRSVVEHLAREVHIGP